MLEQDGHKLGMFQKSGDFVEETSDRGREGTSLDCAKKVAISVNSVYVC